MNKVQLIIALEKLWKQIKKEHPHGRSLLILSEIITELKQYKIKI